MLDKIDLNYFSDTDTYLERLINSEKLVTINENVDIQKTKLVMFQELLNFRIWYFCYIRLHQITKYFIRVERTGNWNLNFVALSKNEYFFTATGYINYTKNARLHLLTMLDLPNTFPRMHKSFRISHNAEKWMIKFGIACEII